MSTPAQPRPAYSTGDVTTYTFPTYAGVLVFYFFFSRFFLEKFLMPKFHKDHYLALNAEKKRSYAVHQFWLILKVCFIPMAWPMINTFFLHKAMNQPIVDGSKVTNSDLLTACYMMIIGMFTFEIIYRLKISPVSLIHHTSAIVLSIWQVATAIGAPDASNDAQFRLILLYGFFEVAFESIPHVAVIYYRLKPDNNRTCARIWFCSFVSALLGTSGELICVAIFFWRHWHQFDLAEKIIMPILHFAFMAAQVHGVRINLQLHKYYLKKWHKQQHEQETLTATASLPKEGSSGSGVTPSDEKDLEAGLAATGMQNEGESTAMRKVNTNRPGAADRATPVPHTEEDLEMDHKAMTFPTGG